MTETASLHPYDAVIFDLDGTLIDSAPDLHAAMNVVLTARGAEPLDLPTLRSFIGNGVPTLIRRSFAARNLPCEGDVHRAALDEFHAVYDAAPAALATAYPGVMRLLETLAARGVPLGLCTNKYGHGTALVLAAFGLTGRFGAVIGGDTLPVLKPDPAPLLLCAERLGVAPARVVYVGDSEVDAETAAAAGIRFALFTGGYRRTPPEAIPALWRFDDFDALAAALGA
jgi:phosphoglycolate phosphatase